MSASKRQLIWIGAGNAKYPSINFSQFSHSTLVEVREDACSLLKKKYIDDSIEIKQALILQREQTSNFYIYSLKELSSSKPADSIGQLFPGVRLISDEKIKSIGFSDFVQSLNLNGKNHTIIIDTPDIAYSLLAGLNEANQLTLFSEIFVLTSSKLLYKEMSDKSSVIGFLQQNFYELKEQSGVDPDLPLLHFTYNEIASRLGIVEKENAELKKKNAKLSTDAKAAKVEFERKIIEAKNEKSQLVRKQKAEQKKFSSQISALLSDNEALRNSSENVKNDLDSARNKIKENESSHINQVAELKKAKDTSDENCQSYARELEGVKSDLQDKREIINRYEKEKEKLEHAKSELSDKIILLEHDLEELKTKRGSEKTQLETDNHELSSKLDHMAIQLTELQDRFNNQSRKLVQYEEKNSTLKNSNELLASRQALLEDEIGKLRSQLNVVKELVLLDKDAF